MRKSDLHRRKWTQKFGSSAKTLVHFYVRVWYFPQKIWLFREPENVKFILPEILVTTKCNPVFPTNSRRWYTTFSQETKCHPMYVFPQLLKLQPSSDGTFSHDSNCNSVFPASFEGSTFSS
jgi:hypothetical protein